MRQRRSEGVGQRRGESGKEDREEVGDNSHYDVIKSMNLFSFRGFS